VKPKVGEEGLLEQLVGVEQRGRDTLARRAVALERLLEVSLEMATLDWESVLAQILRCLLDLTGLARGALVLTEPDGRLHVARAEDRAGRPLLPRGFRLSRSLVAQALGTGEVTVVPQTARSPFADRTSVHELGLGALVAVPLVAGGERLGLLYLDAPAGAPAVAELDRALLAAFGAQAAIALANAGRHRRLEDECFELRRTVEPALRLGGLVYRSLAMHRVVQAVRQVAPQRVPVLLLGETGTGKELLARAIHDLSPRHAARFYDQNAGALADSLLESELFGHRRGAFTGALEAKVGLFEAAHGGTVFLDEIGEASPALQVRLLRLLETGRLRRAGDTVDRQVDVRIVAATHRDLEARVREGAFRADLFYRLSPFPIRVPPLHERPEDLDVLVPHLLERLGRELGVPPRPVPEEQMRRWRARPWPGNVRELGNEVQRHLLQVADLDLDPGSDAPISPPPGPDGAPTPPSTFEAMERALLAEALRAASGNVAEAARRLGLPRGTLRWRLRKLGLAPP
jgi:transcriptional regulator with GAF, ATPase, and Fis domain